MNPEALIEEDFVEVQPELLAYLDDLLCLRPAQEVPVASSPEKETQPQESFANEVHEPDRKSVEAKIPVSRVSTEVQNPSQLTDEHPLSADYRIAAEMPVALPVELTDAPVAAAELTIEASIPSVEKDEVAQPQVSGFPAREDNVSGLAALLGFTALLLECGDIRYLIPLVQLGRITRVERKPVAMAGQPAWQIGLLPGTAQVQKVFSLDRLLGRRCESWTPSFYVALADEVHVFPCTAVHGCVEIKQQGIRWRQGTGKTPLMAGILKEQLIPVLDFTRLDELR